MNSSTEIIHEDQSFYPQHSEESDLKIFEDLGEEDLEDTPPECSWDHKEDIKHTKVESVSREVTDADDADSLETTPSHEVKFSEGDYPVIDTSDSVLGSSEVDRLIPDDEEAEVALDGNNNLLNEETRSNHENESARNVRRVLAPVEIVIDVDTEIEVQGQLSKKRKLEEIEVEDENEIENLEDPDYVVDGSLVDNFPEIDEIETEENEDNSADNEETVAQSQPSTSPASEVEQLVPNNSSEVDFILYSERTSDPLPENWRKLLLPPFDFKQDWENED